MEVTECINLQKLEAVWGESDILVDAEVEEPENSNDNVTWDNLSAYYRDTLRAGIDRDNAKSCACELVRAGSMCSHMVGVDECVYNFKFRDELPIASGGRKGPVPTRAAASGARVTQESANLAAEARSAKRKRPSKDTMEIPAPFAENPDTFQVESFGKLKDSLREAFGPGFVAGIEAEVALFFQSTRTRNPGSASTAGAADAVKLRCERSRG